MEGAIVVGVAVAFVFVSGANDGAALLAVGIRHPDTSLSQLITILIVAMIAGPALVGVAVAEAFTHRLGDVNAANGPIAFLVGVVLAAAVVLLLARRGLPTSLTLALVGALSGVFAGAGRPARWADVLAILAIGALAPVAGGGLGYVLGRLARRAPALGSMPTHVRHAHTAAYAVQCLAYAANDGQKMLAVTAVSLSVAAPGDGPISPRLPWPVLLAIAAAFLAGAITSLRRVSRRVAYGLLPVRPMHTAAAQLAAATAVLASAGAGTPVSMTQSLSAGIVGAGTSQGWRRVRWHTATQIALAWLTTLPASLAAGAAAGLVIRAVE